MGTLGCFRTKLTEVSCSRYIGDVTSIDIRIDGTDGWILAWMMVVNRANNDAVTFQCNCLFDDGADALSEAAVSRTLVLGKAVGLLCGKQRVYTPQPALMAALKDSNEPTGAIIST